MQAVVLVGGEGTRLRPLTLTRPKPALTLVDRPFIRYMVEWLGRHGIDEVIMACGFKAEALRDALGDELESGITIAYIEEDEPLGTAGPVRLAADEGLLGERFMVLNGDVLTDLDLTALQRQHAETGAAITLALYPVADPTQYGLVRRRGGPSAPGEEPAEPGGEVLGFLEKPDAGAIDTDEVSAGAYVIERRILDLIPAGRTVSIEREVFPRVVGQGLFARRLEGYWMDIGTPERYLEASWDILENRVETDVTATGDGVLTDPTATVGDGAEVGPRAVLAPGCEIGDDARVVGSVLLDGCVLGDGATVEGAILAPRVDIGAGATVGTGAVLGEGATVAAGATVPADARVQPGELVAAEAVAP